MQLETLQPTLLDVYQVYLKERVLKPRTLKDYDNVIYKYSADWQHIKMKDISRRMIQDRHLELSKTSKAQANLAMRVFRAIYNFAKEHYLDLSDQSILPSDNLVQTLSAKRTWNKIKRRKNYINEDKMQNWLNVAMTHEHDDQADVLIDGIKFILVNPYGIFD